MKHIWEVLNYEAKYYIHIFKGLHLMEFMIKNGNTRIIQDLKDDIFKIKSLQDCTFHDDGIDKCRGIRDKAKAIIDLLNDPARLDEEREFSLK
jgi:epsin